MMSTLFQIVGLVFSLPLFQIVMGLSFIMPHPELVETPLEMSLLLYKMSKNPNIFISAVSGRELDDVISRFKVANLNYAGNHGSGMWMADGS